MTPHIRFAIKLRYRLIPYLYSLSLESALKGSPIIRPLFYEFQCDPKTDEMSFEYMLGPNLLIASVVEPDSCERSLYLPLSSSSSDWCDFFTGKWYHGGQSICVPVPINQPGAVFALEGSIIPMHHRDIPYIDAKQPDDTRTILLFPSMAHKEFYSVIKDCDQQNGKIFEYRVCMRSTPEKVCIEIENFDTLPFNQIHFELPKNDPRPVPPSLIKLG